MGRSEGDGRASRCRSVQETQEEAQSIRLDVTITWGLHRQEEDGDHGAHAHM